MQRLVILQGPGEVEVTFEGQLVDKKVYLEWADINLAAANTTLTLEQRDATGAVKPQGSDQLTVFPFRGIVIAIGGLNEFPSDPPPDGVGAFDIALKLYTGARDVHM